VAEFVEVESGKRYERPELAKAMAACRKHKAQLIIAKLDRLARNVHFISGLMEFGVPFVAADRPNARPFELHIFAAMAEQEARDISDRTVAALAAASAPGTRLRNPRNPPAAAARGRATMVRRADEHAANVLPVIESIRRAGIISLGGIAEALNARGVKTARGGAWYAATVRNVLRRAGE
jgi:DNA invertase Pin-like site-specific DNA recombinase